MSRQIVVACICWIFFLAAFVVSGCSPEKGAAPGTGAVGVWTKADSVTLFEDFGYAAGSGR